ncbi:MAG: plastocyanin/azurin family copper-binding protein [Longimicrobiales bacterium]
MTLSGVVFWAGLVLLALGSTACRAESPPESDEQPAPAEAVSVGPDTIDVILDDYVFGMPDSLPSGEIILRISNVGLEEHDMSFVQALGSPIAWRLPRRLAAGEESIHTLTLEPGTYQVLCDFAGHIGRGMVATVQVGKSGG